VELTKSSNKDILLIERFDRIKTDQGWQRRSVLSALTLFGLDEMMARYASYGDLAEIIRHNFTDTAATLKELFGRLIFNILCSNTDDHTRNRAAFWDGSTLFLTPAYDICPQGRTDNETGQSMLISADDRQSRISSCLDSAHQFLLSEKEAMDIIAQQVSVITECWDEVCILADLNETDRRLFWGRQFLNPFAFENLAGDAVSIKFFADKGRAKNQV
jgi:serine/threonine-protein kinase HipA